METIRSSEMSVLTRATRSHVLKWRHSSSHDKSVGAKRLRDAKLSKIWAYFVYRIAYRPKKTVPVVSWPEFRGTDPEVPGSNPCAITLAENWWERGKLSLMKRTEERL
jgi:hypothetical protein